MANQNNGALTDEAMEAALAAVPESAEALVNDVVASRLRSLDAEIAGLKRRIGQLEGRSDGRDSGSHPATEAGEASYDPG